MAEGKKKVRLCPCNGCAMHCDGLCYVVSDDNTVHICPVRQKALDVALNVRQGSV